MEEAPGGMERGEEGDEVKVTIESTDELVLVEAPEMPARVWKGQSEAGVPVVCFILAISPQTHDEAVNAQFAAELIEWPSS